MNISAALRDHLALSDAETVGGTMKNFWLVAGIALFTAVVPGTALALQSCGQVNLKLIGINKVYTTAYVFASEGIECPSREELKEVEEKIRMLEGEPKKLHIQLKEVEKNRHPVFVVEVGHEGVLYRGLVEGVGASFFEAVEYAFNRLEKTSFKLKEEKPN